MKTLAMLGALATALLTTAPAVANEQLLGFGGDDGFGFSVAAEGGTLVVGASGDARGTGAVYVFQRIGDDWVQSGKLTASDGEQGDVLGVSVAIDGDEIVAGAPGDAVGMNRDQGSAYTFARTGPPTRTETHHVTAADGTGEARFGTAVTLEGDSVVVGAPGDSTGKNAAQGAAYTFSREGEQTAKLTASDGAVGDRLGTSVAIDGDTIVAGAPEDTIDTSAQQGSAYTFARAGDPVRGETAKLIGTESGDDTGFGTSVAIDGDTIVVGAPAAVVATSRKGAAFTFTRGGAAQRTQTAKLTTTDGEETDNLGRSVAIDGDTILAGANGDTVDEHLRQGSAYTFARSGLPTRRETGKLVGRDGAENDQFGAAVALDGDTSAVGAIGRGTVSVFFAPTPPPPPPPPPPPAKPSLSRLAVNARRHSASFRLSQAAGVRLTLVRVRRGARSATVRTLRVNGRGGRNVVKLSRRPLRRGHYRLTAIPAGGDARTARFAVARRASAPRSARAARTRSPR